MANTKSAAKRARQTQRRTLANKRVSTGLKTQLKNTRAVVGRGSSVEAKTAAKELISALDRAVKTGRIHRNRANKHKSAIGKKLAALK